MNLVLEFIMFAFYEWLVPETEIDTSRSLDMHAYSEDPRSFGDHELNIL